MKILVVDDERWIRKGIVKMIQGKHEQIEEIYEADGLNSGWDKFNEVHPEIVVSDVRFPVGNGCQLCKKIHELYPATKIIMLSGYSDFEYARASLKYKALDYLLKPVDTYVLNETIDRAINEIKDSEKGNIKRDKVSNQDVRCASESIIDKIIEEIKENYWEKISLLDLAERYHINSAYLSEMFSKTVGISLVNFQKQIRVEKAKSMLFMTDESVTIISQKVGYEDVRYFHRVFKQITGMSPKEYRIKTRSELGYEEKEI